MCRSVIYFSIYASVYSITITMYICVHRSIHLLLAGSTLQFCIHGLCNDAIWSTHNISPSRFQALHLLGDVSWRRLKSPNKPYNPAQLWFSKASISPRTKVSKIYTWKNTPKKKLFWPLNLKKIESPSMFHWDMPCHALPVGKRLQPSQPWHRKGWLQPNYRLYMLPGIKGNNETSKVNFPSPSFT